MSEVSCEVLVVGAGPAGMAAAATAAESGSSVVLLDENSLPGGQIWRASRGSIHNETSIWMDRFRRAGGRLVQGASVFDGTSSWLRAEGDRFSFRKLVLATGARELFLPFPGWTLPNVTGVGGLQALAKGGLDLTGKRIVVAGSGPLLVAVAGALTEYGGKVVAIVEQAPPGKLFAFGLGLAKHPSKLLQARSMSEGLRKTIPGTWVTMARGTDRVQSVSLTNGRRSWRIECDYLACAFGLVPNTELASLIGCNLEDGAVWVDEMQRTTVEHVLCAGEPTGIGGVDLAVTEGRIAGLAAAGRNAEAKKLFLERKKHRDFARLLNKSFELREEVTQLAHSDTLVCRCEDVSFGQLRDHKNFREAKIHTRCGMGPCQGRICGVATRHLFNWEVTEARPPILPTPLRSLSQMSEE